MELEDDGQAPVVETTTPPAPATSPAASLNNTGLGPDSTPAKVEETKLCECCNQQVSVRAAAYAWVMWNGGSAELIRRCTAWLLKSQDGTLDWRWGDRRSLSEKNGAVVLSQSALDALGALASICKA
eukprot:TRINITY_DN29174_c0_g1_i3.p1 TRINITY_DN29174_c0_g1~~TRINITY_DN29174_c0_g1_i3.p1  ORF type:complete len:127 (-),score=32.21 TRINITY_DN29174_c0_g1_i3:360-740(-)